MSLRRSWGRVFTFMFHSPCWTLPWISYSLFHLCKVLAFCDSESHRPMVKWSVTSFTDPTQSKRYVIYSAFFGWQSLKVSACSLASKIVPVTCWQFLVGHSEVLQALWFLFLLSLSKPKVNEKTITQTFHSNRIQNVIIFSIFCKISIKIVFASLWCYS